MFQGKVVVITGGAGGIGKCIREEFEKAGAKVCIIDVDEDPGYDNAQIIEVLTHDIDLRYLTYLQSMGIPYIFAGDTEIDMEEALFKLRSYFGIKTLLLEGGSILNGAFQRAGVIDELSLVVDPVIGGKGKPLCMDSKVEEYRLVDVKNHDGILWLNYKK